LEEAVLHREEVKRESWFDTVQIQDQRVVLFPANHRGPCARLFKRIGAQAVHHCRVRQQVKRNFVCLVLGGDDAGGGQNAERHQ